MALPRRVFLFGNGLSLCFDEEYYRLGNITSRVQRRLENMPGRGGPSLLRNLEHFDRAIGTDVAGHATTSFEQIAGPIDRLANALSDVGPMQALAEDAGERAVLEAIGQRLRRLYRRIVGAVLENVMAHGNTERHWPYLYSVADHLRQEALRQGQVDVFTLNYDALLEGSLLHIQSQERSRTFDIADEFHGVGSVTIPILGADGDIHEIAALAWRGGPYEGGMLPLIRLHHLHGAGTWLRWRSSVYKAKRLRDLRDCGLYTSWAEGIEGQEDEGDWVSPAVLLGDQKERWVTAPPFNESYERLSVIATADELVVAGYGFAMSP